MIGKFNIVDFIKVNLGTKICKEFTIYLLLSIVIGVVEFLLHQDAFQMLRWIALIFILIMLSRIDMKKYIVPNCYIISGIVFATIISLLEMCINKSITVDNVIKNVFYLLMVSLILIIFKSMVRDNIGMGDLKLVFMLGFYYEGTELISLIFISLFLSGIFSMISLFLKKRNKKDCIPFVPFLCLGCIIYWIINF